MALLVEFRTRFPEFAAEADARVQLFLDDAEFYMSDPDKWLGYYDRAHVYYAAHLLTLATATLMGDTTPMAPVKKQEVDDVIVEQAIADVKATDDMLLSTSYGKHYWQLRRVITVGIYGV